MPSGTGFGGFARNYSVLDFSFNLLRAVPETISSLTSLATIYFVQNKITKIDNLHPFGATLKSLELGGNRIRVSFLRALGCYLTS